MMPLNDFRSTRNQIGFVIRSTSVTLNLRRVSGWVELNEDVDAIDGITSNEYRSYWLHWKDDGSVLAGTGTVAGRYVAVGCRGLMYAAATVCAVSLSPSGLGEELRC